MVLCSPLQEIEMRWHNNLNQLTELIVGADFQRGISRCCGGPVDVPHGGGSAAAGPHNGRVGVRGQGAGRPRRRRGSGTPPRGRRISRRGGGKRRSRGRRSSLVLLCGALIYKSVDVNSLSCWYDFSCQ